jgi:hypothetical protein
MKGDNVIDDPGVSVFNSRVTALCELGTFSLGEKGHVGLVPSTIREGDLIFVFEDGRVPIILMPRKGHHTWKGAAYIHGIMYEEGLVDPVPGSIAVFLIQ